MPEFEESDPQPDPQHSYTPGTGAPKSKGGRRRSGGFKSEATASNSNIGEVNPTEALKADAQKGRSQPKGAPKAQKTCSTKGDSSKSTSCSIKMQPSTDAKPQPEKATLDSIKKVEEKIARRRVESEKSRPAKGATGSKKRARKTSEKASKGGILAAIFQFFGSLFGGSSEDSVAESKGRSYGQRKPRNGGSSRRSDNVKKDSSGKRYKNQRGGSKKRRKSPSSSS